MKKNTQKKDTTEFYEKDIQSAIKYLKTNTSIIPTRENEINHLRSIQGVSHLIAHKVVEKEMSKKLDKKKGLVH